MTQKIALITGGSRGLGKSAALHLAKANVGIVITYQSNVAEAQSIVDEINSKGGRAAALKLDVAESSSFSSFRDSLISILKETFERNTFDYLVNNAGYGIFTPFEKTTEAELDDMYAVHLKGPFFLTQCLARFIEDGGRILNVSSGLTRMTFSGYDAYAAMKGGLEVVTRYQAAAYASRGIAVNTIAPGAIETDFGGGAVRDTPKLNQHIASTTAMGRVGLPDDIGSAVAGLLVAGSGWMTGQRLEVSGGQSL
ncbi:SDR family NAD(P)-dependent oxidoreductase [Reinekea blandensis]|uniref:Short-chain alcohol dehydrogenase-like protein n=1 Tax=Reinekea blandensis MED297 TaxID=314283 RepID=A4BKJ4_9GAMM|nr:SDR family oxidoreductase [Reinekea blandensis]EAR07347.1 short-chain alcohol dehydrogenase-like protein [Reinekea sp. MED297] [Reinekea blandensis MED297]